MSKEKEFAKFLEDMDRMIARNKRMIAFIRGYTESIERWRLQKYISKRNTKVNTVERQLIPNKLKLTIPR